MIDYEEVVASFLNGNLSEVIEVLRGLDGSVQGFEFCAEMQRRLTHDEFVRLVRVVDAFS